MGIYLKNSSERLTTLCEAGAQPLRPLPGTNSFDPVLDLGFFSKNREGNLAAIRSYFPSVDFWATVADNLTLTNPRIITFIILFFLILCLDDHVCGLYPTTNGPLLLSSFV